jgi:NAD(P)-dependent dehydrogenase (short-subunit alcohol dehydrogenase family)
VTGLVEINILLFYMASNFLKSLPKNWWKLVFGLIIAYIIGYLIYWYAMYEMINEQNKEIMKRAKIPMGSKTVMITGGASGIGYAYSNALLDLGYNVVIIDIKNAVESANALESVNPDRKGRIHGIAGNVANKDSMTDAFIKASKYASGGVFDAVILNAGIDKPLFEDDTHIVETNLLGPIYGTELYVKQITENLSKKAPEEKDYQIIITGSLASFIPIDMNLSPVYDATKAGIGQFVRSYKPFSTRYNFRINAVCPAGMVETGLTKPFITTQIEKIGMYAYMTAEGRGGLMQPEQIVPGMLDVLTDKKYNGDLIAVQPNLTFISRLEPRDEGRAFVEYGEYEENKSYPTKAYIDYKINNEYLGHREYVPLSSSFSSVGSLISSSSPL